jgi:uncharacterized protein (DUF1015 family)
MSALFPFRALRPDPETASQVAAVPYDVVTTPEARALVKGHPLSFLRVTRPEVDLPPNTNPYDERVYAQAVRNFEDLKRAAPLLLEEAPSLYLYRLKMGAHEQTGLAGCFSLDEYDRDLIKKHERTRKDKEDDRTRHMLELRAQTGLVFLTYRASHAIDAIAARVKPGAPLYDFVAEDRIAHTVWRVPAGEQAALIGACADLPALYIADGHHRVASAARARTALTQQGRPPGSADRFAAVAFPDSQVQILPYHRVVRDRGGLTAAALLTRLRERMRVSDGGPIPQRAGEVSMYLAGRWYALELPAAAANTPRADALDVAALERDVLGPFLKIGDIRTDKRIDFVGGGKGIAELERRVDAGDAAVAFSLTPVTIEDLMAIADAGGIMPPKSTWFEPKLRDGLLVHLFQ